MKNKKYVLLSFLIPCILTILLYTTVGIIGGNKNILTVDLADQYIAFFNTLKNVLNGTISPFYSFSKTLGGNIFGIITYYLMSPLNIIVVFFNRIDIPKAILIINILKISFSGLTSYIYFDKTFKNNNLTSLTFSIIYSMMAYNIVYSQNIMWLDGVIMLPIIFLGIDKLIEKKPRIFYISLTLSIVFNYYIGYMSCIASLIYFIYKHYLKENKIVIKEIVNFIKYILMAVLTSSAILIPSLISLLQGKASGILQEFIPNQKFALLDIITRFYIGTFKTTDLEVGCPNIYISLITIVLVIYYFFNKKINNKEKKATCILLFVFMLSFMIYPIDVIWHTFKHPYGFPFRYSFVFDFIMLIIAYKSIIELDNIDKEFIKKFILYSFILTLVVDKVLYTKTMYYKALGTFILLIIYLVYLAKNKKIKNTIILLIILEMFTNDFLIVINLKYQDKQKYKEFVNNTGYVIDKLNEKEEFYRLEKDYSYSTNDELLLNYNGISHFSSVYEEKNNQLLKKLGIFNRFYITNYNGSTPVTNSLLNIKYILSKGKIEYYEKIDTYKDINIYENIYNLPLGFSVDNDIKNLELSKTNPFENQNNILKKMDENIKDVFINNNYKIELNNLKLENKNTYRKINKNAQASIKLELKVENSGLLYNYIDSTKNKKIDILINGKSIIDITNQNDYNYNIIEIGNYNQNDIICVEYILLEETIQPENIMFYTLNKENFGNAIEILKRHDALRIINYTQDNIKTNINIQKQNQILYTSIPYDKGMTVYIDGKEIKPIKIFDTLIGIELSKGNHVIEFKYKARGLRSGMIMSVLGVGIFILDEVKDDKRRNTNKMQNRKSKI